MKENRIGLFYVSLLYRISTISLMFSMIIVNDLYKGFSIDDTYLILLGITSIIILLVYNQVQSHDKIVKIAVYIEVGTLLYIYFITGGIYSPIIWLVVNPAVFYMFYYRKASFLQNLMIIFTLTTLLGPYMVDKQLNIEIVKYFPGLFLAIMIFIILSMLSKQYVSNNNTKDSLELMRQALEKEVNLNETFQEWFLSSYDLVDQLLYINDEEEGLDEIFKYMSKNPHIDGFFIKKDESPEKIRYSSKKIEEIVNAQNHDYIIKEYVLEGQEHYGYFGVLYHKSKTKELSPLSLQNKVLAKMITLFYDRNQFRTAYVHLLIKDEQNRIAGEIHDGIKQDIHGMTYYLYNVLQQGDKLDKEGLIEKVRFAYESTSEMTNTLKKAIYKLDGQSENRDWIESIQTLIKRLESQYNIEIRFKYDQYLNDMPVSIGISEAMIRSIKEATSNAVEHGSANLIKVEIILIENCFNLTIINNGSPFDVHKNKSGLGINNMKKLALIHKGEFSMTNLGDHGVKIEMSFYERS